MPLTFIYEGGTNKIPVKILSNFMHFKVFYDIIYYLSIETLKQEDIQVDLYSVGTTLLYVSYVFFTAF